MAIDALIAVASLTAVLAIVVAIDNRAGAQMARVIAGGGRSEAGIVMQVRDDTVSLVRSAWDMSQMHAPLMTFAGVAALLVLLMVRTK